MVTYSYRYKVLLVESSIDDSQLVQKFLAQDTLHRYDVTHAETGHAALLLFQKSPPDLLLVGFNLPDMTGLDLFQRLQLLTPNHVPPGILLIEHGNEAIALEAMKSAISDYLPKRELTFPRLMQGIYAMLMGTPPQPSLKQFAITIAIVDDSPIDLEVYSRFLQSDTDTSYNIKCFEDPQDALVWLENKMVDVVLVDHSMPEITGIEFIDALRPERYQVGSVIMMTGMGNEELVVQAIKAGASDYLVKQSITPESLRKVVRQTVYNANLIQQVEELRSQSTVLTRIRIKLQHCIEIQSILEVAVSEIQQYVQCDRALIYQLEPGSVGKVVAECCSENTPPLLHQKISDTFFQDSQNRYDYAKECYKHIIPDVSQANISECHRQLLEGFGVKSVLSLPILAESIDPPLWGLLIIHYCREPYSWQVSEVAFLNELAVKIGLGVQQGLLVEGIRQERDRANRATAAKSLFLANMSHEIRTPIHGILGMAEMLSFSPNLNTKEREFLSVIEASGKSLLNLINDILDLSKLEAGRIELKIAAFSLHQVAQETIELFRLTCQDKGINLILQLPPDLPDPLLGDAYRIRQVLNNFVGNAVKFTDTGEIILRIEVIETAQAHRPDQIQLSFEVQDTGIGIQAADQSRLFEPFVQVESASNRRFQGTGLGLSICKKLVEETMRGKLGFSSVPDQGSVFWFTIPLQLPAPVATPTPPVTPPLLPGDLAQDGAVQDGAPQTNAPRTNTPQNSTATNPTIAVLVVEDNPNNRKILQAQLQLLNYRCDVVDNGQAALERLVEQEYDIILMDCRMRILDGYATTAEIRRTPNWQQMPIIGLTAYAMEGDAEKCLEAGMNDYLSKPYTLPQLRQTLQTWTQNRLDPSD